MSHPSSEHTKQDWLPLSFVAGLLPGKIHCCCCSVNNDPPMDRFLKLSLLHQYHMNEVSHNNNSRDTRSVLAYTSTTCMLSTAVQQDYSSRRSRRVPVVRVPEENDLSATTDSSMCMLLCSECIRVGE